MMRLADADLLPFSYTPQSEAIANYEKELERLLKDKQDEFTELKLELEEGVFAATADPRKPILPPAAESVPPYMSFARMKNALELFKASSERYAEAQKSWEAQGSPSLTAQSLNRVNTDLLEISRMFLNERGLPERPWFKNQIYAPGAYTGYDARPIAAVREYMDEKKWEKADAEIPQVSEAIERAAKGNQQSGGRFGSSRKSSALRSAVAVSSSPLTAWPSKQPRADVVQRYAALARKELTRRFT